MELTGMTTEISIVVIAYLIGIAAKLYPKVNDQMIPVIVGVAGGLLGVAGMYLIPEFPATNILHAIAVGIISGLASTGANQITKLFKS